jgi:hypothetical protein
MFEKVCGARTSGQKCRVVDMGRKSDGGRKKKQEFIRKNRRLK